MNGAAEAVIVEIARATVEISTAPTLNEAHERITRIAHRVSAALDRPPTKVS